MTIVLSSRVGDFGVPGFGTLKRGQSIEVDNDAAGWAATRPDELELRFNPEDGSRSTVGVFSPLDARFGYGNGGNLLVQALDKLGRSVFIHRSSTHFHRDEDMPPAVAKHLRAPRAFPRWTLAHCLPDNLPMLRSPRAVAYTMWETSRIPDSSHPELFGDWAQLINKHVQRLVVPCQHNTEVFASCGVELPVSVIPYGLDTDFWPFIERPKDRPTFTFVQLGDLTERKGPRETVAAFQRAFPDEQDARLILKTQWGHLGHITNGQMPNINDPRIEIINDTWSRSRVLGLLWMSDAFVWPSRGEGFGLPPVQALLTGMPVITTTHTGMAEWFDAKYAYGVRSVGTSPAPLYGEWFEPDVDHLAEQMRKVYENRAAAVRKAKAGAAHLRKQFSLDAYAARLGAFLNTLEE